MRYRTIWISDVHLGTRGCSAERLLEFLRDNESDTLYLVGDIIDGWALRRSVYWPQSHSDVVQKLLRKARKGTRVVYVPGNHDEALRGFVDNTFGGVELVRECDHLTADGRKLLVMHGDEFDQITTHHKWVAVIGDVLYNASVRANVWNNQFRRRMGWRPWSFSAFLKHRVKKVVNFISSYEQVLAAECRRRAYDGIVCGHIHHAEMETIEGVLYCNTGDWVESCTALVEHDDGRLELLSL